VEKKLSYPVSSHSGQNRQKQKNRCLRSAGGGGKRKNILDRKGLTLSLTTLYQKVHKSGLI